MSVAYPRSVAAKKFSSVQYAALPFRLNGAELEILLVTTKHTRRWIIPKGWPIEGCPPEACAAREAMEEAGVSGEVESVAAGFFHYFKTLKRNIVVPCKVEVFALKVIRSHRLWADKDARDRRWYSVDQAVALIVEPELRRLIRKFAENQLPGN